MIAIVDGMSRRQNERESMAGRLGGMEDGLIARHSLRTRSGPPCSLQRDRLTGIRSADRLTARHSRAALAALKAAGLLRLAGSCKTLEGSVNDCTAPGAISGDGGK